MRLAGILMLMLTGCGTVENMRTEGGRTPQPMGGVKGDLKACRAVWQETPPGLAYYPLCIGTSCGRVLDLPFSLVGDYFTYPHTQHQDFWPITPTPDWPDPNKQP